MNIEELRQGHVISVSLGTYDGIHPKDGYMQRRKYFVVLGVCKGYALLGGIVFNSAVNPQLPEALRACHIPVSCSKYTFLDHDSYFDCSKLIKPRFATIASAQLIGQIDAPDCRLIIETLHSSPRVRAAELQIFNL